jgi:hypothetical protein
MRTKVASSGLWSTPSNRWLAIVDGGGVLLRRDGWAVEDRPLAGQSREW